MSLDKLLLRTINKNGFMDLPVLSHINDNLFVGVSPAYWMGGEDNFPHIFNFFVASDPEDRYEVRHTCRYTEMKMRDSSDQPMAQREFIDIAHQIVEARQKGPTLVHCQMGINRSNLFAALSLMIDPGLTAEEAILMLRTQRSVYVLMNRHFEKWLLEVPRESLKKHLSS